jgi:DNA-binding transcriptional MocR family regulator
MPADFLYEQLAAELGDAIERGALRAGARLPSVRRLAEDRALSRRQQRLRQRDQPRLGRRGLPGGHPTPTGSVSSTWPATATRAAGWSTPTTTRSPTGSRRCTPPRPARFPGVPTMIERDDRIPPLAELVAELDAVRAIAERAR